MLTGSFYHFAQISVALTKSLSVTIRAFALTRTQSVTGSSIAQTVPMRTVVLRFQVQLITKVHNIMLSYYLPGLFSSQTHTPLPQNVRKTSSVARTAFALASLSAATDTRSVSTALTKRTAASVTTIVSSKDKYNFDL